MVNIMLGAAPMANANPNSVLELESILVELKGPDHSLRIEATRSIKGFAAGDAKIVDRLIKATAGEPWFATESIRSTLVEVGEKAVPPLSAELSSSDKKVREASALTLAAIGRGSLSALQRLSAAYSVEIDTDVKKALILAVASIGQPGVAKLPDMLRNEGNWELIRFAVQHLASLGKGAKGAEPVLIRALAGTWEDFNPAQETLYALGPQVIPALFEFIKADPEAKLAAQSPAGMNNAFWISASQSSTHAGQVLSRFGDKSFPFVVRLLNDPNPVIRESGIRVLSAMGADGKSLWPKLESMQNDPSPQAVGGLAKAVLEDLLRGSNTVNRTPPAPANSPTATAPASSDPPQIEADLSISSALSILSSSPAEFKEECRAMFAIAVASPPARSGIDLMASTFRKNLREEYIYAFSILGPAGKPAIPILADIIERHYCRGQSCWKSVIALSRIGESATKTLREMLKSNDAFVKSSASIALSKMIHLDKESMPELVAALDDRGSAVYAARALGRIGKQGAAALPALVWASGLKDAALRESAISSISAIDSNHVLANQQIIQNGLPSEWGIQKGDFEFPFSWELIDRRYCNPVHLDR